MSGQTINLTVTTTQDENDGSSFQGEGLSLRDAILQANADYENNYVINLPAGTYDLTIKNVLLPTTDASVDLDTLFQSRLGTGDLDIIGNITIIGESPETTIIDAETLKSELDATTTIGDRIFDVLFVEGDTPEESISGSLVVENITIQNGYMTDQNIESSTFNGGAVNIYPDGEAKFINSIIADSRVTSGQGGGINNDGTLTLDQTIVRGNNSSDNAGGIYNAGILTIYNSAIINNLADAAAPDVIEGGGGGVLNENTGTLVMVNTTVSGNKSASGEDQNGPGDGGGGILSRGVTRIINSTIVNNAAQVGSGIYSETTEANTILVNTIVAKNTGSPDLDGFFDDRSSYNFIGNGNGALVDGRNNNIVGGSTTTILDPLIGPLQNNGGTTPTHALLSGSPALDRGNNDMVDVALFFPESPATDQTGSERISNSIIDIGAYEFFVASSNNSDDSSSTLGSEDSTNSVNNSDDSSSTLGSEDSTNSVNNSDDSSSALGSEDSTNSVNNSDDSSSALGSEDSTNSTDGINIPDVSTTNTDDLDQISSPDLETPIYRFQNMDAPGTYLYAGQEESNNIQSSFHQFQDEGFAFNVGIAPDDDLIAMYRFQSNSSPGTYLYVGEQERQSILQNNRNFVDEGIAFYVYEGDANKGADIYRLQNTNVLGTYIFVTEQEKNSILQNYHNFTLEGVAFEVKL